MEMQTFRSPKWDSSTVYPMLLVGFFFFTKFFPSQTEDLVKFGASNNIMIHQTELLPKEKVPQK